MASTLEQAPQALSKKPTRPLTAYNLFFHDQRQLIQEEAMSTTGSKAHFTEVTKIVGSRWRKLDQQGRLHYKKLAAKDKQRYAVELVQWKIQQEHIGQQRGVTARDTPSNYPQPPLGRQSSLPPHHHTYDHRVDPRRSEHFVQAQRQQGPRQEPTLVEKLQTLLSFMDHVRQQRPQHVAQPSRTSQFPSFSRAYEPMREERAKPNISAQRGFNKDDVRFLEDTFGIPHE
jgi:hypothetical protein